MPVSTPDPRYFKDGAGLKPRLRMLFTHPRTYFRLKRKVGQA